MDTWDENLATIRGFMSKTAYLYTGPKNPFLCPDERVATGEGRLAQWGRTKFEFYICRLLL